MERYFPLFVVKVENGMEWNGTPFCRPMGRGVGYLKRIYGNEKKAPPLEVRFHQKTYLIKESQINTTEETFQSDIIDSTIFQTNSFDVLSEFALLVSSTTCSAYSSVLSNESEKMFQQNFQNNLFHLNKFDNDSEFFGQRNCCSADCVAGPA